MRKGSKHTIETRLKMSEIAKRRIGPFKGKKHSYETKRKISENKKGHTTRLGAKVTKETKSKISESLKEFYKQNGTHWTNRKHSNQAKEKMRQKQLGKKPSQETKLKISQSEIGDKNGNWRGGIAFLPYSQTWTETLKKAIRQRDNYICQICGKEQQRPQLDVHHIDYDKEHDDPENLVSLCKVCHTKTSYNRAFWVKFFQSNRKLMIIK